MQSKFYNDLGEEINETFFTGDLTHKITNTPEHIFKEIFEGKTIKTFNKDNTSMTFEFINGTTVSIEVGVTLVKLEK